MVAVATIVGRHPVRACLWFVQRAVCVNWYRTNRRHSSAGTITTATTSNNADQNNPLYACQLQKQYNPKNFTNFRSQRFGAAVDQANLVIRTQKMCRARYIGPFGMIVKIKKVAYTLDLHDTLDIPPDVPCVAPQALMRRHHSG